MRKDIAASYLLHHENALSHTCLGVREFLAKHNVAPFPQPNYSPDLASGNLFLFPGIKTALKGHHFDNIEAIQVSVTTALCEVIDEAFQGVYRERWERWRKKCIDAHGQYF